MQLPDLLDLIRVRAVAVRARDLEHGGQILERGVSQEDAELLAEQTLADVRVPVAVRAERRLGVVDVQRTQPVEADPLVELVEDAIQLVRLGYVVAGHEQVARVEADAEERVAAEPVDEE